MPATVVWHPDYAVPLRPGHPFPMSKYGYLRAALDRRGLMPAGGWLAPAPLAPSQIAAAHDFDYVERVCAGTLRPDEIRRIGLPASAAVARRSLLACAGSLLAGRLALERGVALNAAGGSHHAGPGHGAGFCVFNDVAVAARILLAEGRVGRVLVVDCDVHQGDGTALIFQQESRVVTLSLHAEKNFPARKARSDLDLGLPDGTGDAAYLAALDGALSAVLGEQAASGGRAGDAHRASIGRAGDERLTSIWRAAGEQDGGISRASGEHPASGAAKLIETDPTSRKAPLFDLVFYNAGVDVTAGDRLGRLALSAEGLRARERLVLGRLRAAGLPVAVVMGGGYSTDPEELAARHAEVFAAAAEL